MSDLKHYVIRGGVQGRERLKLLSRVNLDISNVEFRAIDIREHPTSPEFDVVHARFLLTHLSDPAAAVSAFYDHLKPGGLVIVQDIDFTGHFVYPDSRAFRRFHELYCRAVRRRGGD